MSRADTWTREASASDEDRYTSCGSCGGNGQVRNRYFPQQWDTCSRCHGSGEVRR